MQAARIPPNVVTFSTLINKAKDYESGRTVLAEMQAAGVRPSVLTLSTLFSRNLALVNPDELLRWYLNQPNHPEGPMEACISSYRRVGLIEYALAIALNYPHLAASRKLIRTNQDAAFAYFRAVVDLDPLDGNGNYALGIAFIEVQRPAEAVPYLQKALIHARIRDKTCPRVNHIEQLLQRIPDANHT